MLQTPRDMNPYQATLKDVLERALSYFDTLDDQPVGVNFSPAALKSQWSDKLPDEGIPVDQIIKELDQASRDGLMSVQSGRFFSWVIGGSHPSALAADWLTSVWDQNAGLYSVAPSASIAEEIAGEWLKQIFHLPAQASFAFVTGCQMAHFTCLNAARNHVYGQVGWDVEKKGLSGAPPIQIISSDQAHISIHRAVRMLGFGTDAIMPMATDAMGKIIVSEFEKAMHGFSGGPAILVLQAGDVNTGVYDDFEKIIPVAHRHNIWVHIDGAFGLWATACKDKAYLTKGIELADSWATDGHKWLNVPYDCGYAFTAHPEAHYRSLTHHASYVTQGGEVRDPMNWTPEFSRRARGFATYAVLRELGTKGIDDLISRTCRFAHEIVTGIGSMDHAEIIALPVINQGLLRFKDPVNGNDDEFTEKVIHEINLTGEAFFQPTTYKGKRCMRVSVSGWRTTEEDVQRTIQTVKTVLEKYNLTLSHSG